MYKQWYIFLNNNITRNLEIRLSFGKYGPKEHKGYTHIHFPSFCSGTTWHEKNQLSTVLPTANIPCF